MTEPIDRPGGSFESLAAESQVVRSARYLPEDQPLSDAQRRDITDRCLAFLREHRLTQRQLAREASLNKNVVSNVLRLQYSGPTADTCLVRLNNWLELAARRYGLIGSKRFVETAVARDILAVLSIVAETCAMGVVFGPARLGKSFTLEAIENDQRFGCPVLLRVDEARTRPFALCRDLAGKFKLSVRGTFDVVFGRVAARLKGTRRTLIWDEVDRVQYAGLEFIRDVHDVTGCPVLLCGKPVIYDRLGFREAGGFKAITDQLAGRIVICRDLLERTQGEHPEPLYSLADIRALIGQAGLQLRVSPDAERWLQDRAGTLGQGGIGKVLIWLYLAAKLAFVQGDDVLTSEHLEAVVDLALGREDAARGAAMVAAGSGMRRAM